MRWADHTETDTRGAALYMLAPEWRRPNMAWHACLFASCQEDMEFMATNHSSLSAVRKSIIV
jgi:hypothetical protein